MWRKNWVIIIQEAEVNMFLLDRYKFEDLSFTQFTFQEEPLMEKMQERLLQEPAVQLSYTDFHFDKAAKTVSLTLKAGFLQDINDKELRFNLWVVEGQRDKR